MLDSQGADPPYVESASQLVVESAVVESNGEPTVGFGRRYGRRAMLWSAIAACYWLTLVIATHLPAPEAIVGKLLDFDKVVHAVAYFVLATVLFITARRLGSSSSLKTRLLIVFGVLVYGAFDELTQTYFGRSCDLADWFADAGGVGLAFIIDLIRKR